MHLSRPQRPLPKNEPQRRILSRDKCNEGAYYSTITMMNDGVNTSYNGLQASARHRLNHGYSLLFNYTYSHCLQDTETIGNKLQGNTQTNPTNMRFDYGPCDYDLRQNMNASVVYQGYNSKPDIEPDRRRMVAVIPGLVQQRLSFHTPHGHGCVLNRHRPGSAQCRLRA